MIKEVTYLYEPEPSQTQPGQAMPVSEILHRFTNGQFPSGQRIVHYDKDPDFDSYDPTLDPDFDLVDAHYRLQQIGQNFLKEKEENDKEKEPSISDAEIADESTPQISEKTIVDKQE